MAAKPKATSKAAAKPAAEGKSKTAAAAENKWRKIAQATKGAKARGRDSDDDEDVEEEEEESSSEEEQQQVVKRSAVTKKAATKPAAKKQLLDSDEDEDSEDEEPSGAIPLKSARAKVNALAKKGAKQESESESESEDEDDEEESEDGEEDSDAMEEEDDESEESEEEQPVKSKKNESKAKPAQKSKKLKLDDDDNEDEDEDEVRLTHRGEEVEDDEKDADEYLEESESDEAAEEGETDELAEDDEDATLTPQELGERIKDTSAALSDFKAYKKRTKTTLSRAQLVARLAKDCAAYYGYLPDLIDLFLTLFGPTEMVEFLEANEVSRPTCIRANTLKTTRRELAKALTARGIGLEPVADWTNLGLKVFESEIPIGATPEYLAGHYMLQSASSLAPVMALDPRPGEKILDMCAAPGGKTTHIAQLMRNEGLLIANDAKLPRMVGLAANLARMGVKIATCVNQDGRDFPKVMGGFDRILLDAPCSGLGVIPYDKTVKQSRTLQDIASTANLQRELLLAAIDSCDFKSKEGGIIVYSTCSISVQENEQVVQHALERRDVVLVECGFEFGKPGLTSWQGKVFHPSMKLCKRLYPHTHNMDGFFIAKLKKRSNAILENGKPIVKKPAESEEKDNDTPKKSGKDAPKSGKKTAKANSEDDDVSSVSSDEQKRRKKQSEVAKRKNAIMKKRARTAGTSVPQGQGFKSNKPGKKPGKKGGK